MGDERFYFSYVSISGDNIGLLATRSPGYHKCNNHRYTIDHVLDNLCHSIYTRGFGDGLHEGIVSLTILTVNLPITSNCESLLINGF